MARPIGFEPRFRRQPRETGTDASLGRAVDVIGISDAGLDGRPQNEGPEAEACRREGVSLHGAPPWRRRGRWRDDTEIGGATIEDGRPHRAHNGTAHLARDRALGLTPCPGSGGVWRATDKVGLSWRNADHRARGRLSAGNPAAQYRDSARLADGLVEIGRAGRRRTLRLAGLRPRVIDAAESTTAMKSPSRAKPMGCDAKKTFRSEFQNAKGS
jgi:hypothetical protein